MNDYKAERKAVGDRLRDLRMERSITQKGLAEMANVCRTYLNAVEAGAKPISVKMLYSVAAVLKVSVDEIIRW